MTFESQENQDIRQYWDVIWRKKLAITGLALAASLVAVLFVFAVTPVYKAEATILIESQQANVISIEEVYGVDSKNAQYYKTQFQILNSRPLVQSVINQLNLLDRSEYQADSTIVLSGLDWRTLLPFSSSVPSKVDESILFEAAVETYYENLSVVPQVDTQLVNIQFDSSDPKLAASVANSHATAYIQSMLDARMEMTDSAANWMISELKGMQAKLLESERRLQQYREREQLVEEEGLKSLPSREINELTMRLVAIRSEVNCRRPGLLSVRPIRATSL